MSFESSDGKIISAKLDYNRKSYSNNQFAPSTYTGNVSATTTVTGQSAPISTGATKMRIVNMDATNYALISFGVSANDAENNAANGLAIRASQSETLSIPTTATHFAYLGNTGTVVLNISQGA